MQPGAVPARFRNAGIALFLLILAAGAAYVISHLVSDLESVAASSVFPFVLLGIALVIALGFEFVNGFHDTANAVATVIYMHSLSPHLAVVWSGLWNFAGVLTSSGAVAFGILQLLPVELILQVGSHSGFAMVFALLIAAIIYFVLVGPMNKMKEAAAKRKGIEAPASDNDLLVEIRDLLAGRPLTHPSDPNSPSSNA